MVVAYVRLAYESGSIGGRKKPALILARSADVDALIPNYVCVHHRARWSSRIRLYPDKRHQLFQSGLTFSP